MSAKNRAGSRSDKDELYETPGWAVRVILRRLWPEALPEFWLEPCAGRGAIAREILHARPDASVTCIERLEHAEAHLVAMNPKVGYWIGDFFESNVACPVVNPFDGSADPQYDVVIMNPPFSASARFVETCLPLARLVVVLLRLNWLGGAERHAFLREHSPDVYVLPQRPSFRPDGGTDATEYAWMVWRGARQRSSGIVEVLPLVSDEERGIRRGRRKSAEDAAVGS